MNHLNVFHILITLIIAKNIWQCYVLMFSYHLNYSSWQIWYFHKQTRTVVDTILIVLEKLQLTIFWITLRITKTILRFHFINLIHRIPLSYSIKLDIWTRNYDWFLFLFNHVSTSKRNIIIHNYCTISRRSIKNINYNWFVTWEHLVILVKV